MQSRKQFYTLSIEEILYYIAETLFLFTKGIGLNEGDALFRVCFLTGAFLILIKLMIGQYSLKEIIFIGALGVWGVVTFRITGSLGMMVYVFLIVGIKKISIQKVFRVGAAAWGICMLYTSTAAIFFERTGVRRVHEKFGLGPLLRESLGYTHPNVLHVTYVVFMAFVLFRTKKEGKKLFNLILLLFAGNVFVFIYSLSLTGVLFSMVYLAMFFYFRNRKNLSKMEGALVQLIPPACVLISLLAPLFIKDGFFYQVFNKLLNNRVWAIKAFYELYPVTLFGMRSEGMTFSLDNSYAYALMNYGVWFILIMVLAYSLLIRYCLINDKREELAIICSFLIAGLSEPFLFNASIKNITVFFLGEYLYKTFEGDKIIYKPFVRLNREVVFSNGVRNILDSIRSIISKKTAAILFVAIFMVMFGIVLPKNCEGIEDVYADESMCDCEGNAALLPEIDESGNTLYIGGANKNVRYYHFTYQNSNLIAVMDLRKRISISLYTACLGSLLVMLIWGNVGLIHKTIFTGKDFEEKNDRKT